MSEDRATHRAVLAYAVPPVPPLRTSSVTSGFLVGWGIGLATAFVCMCLMCGLEFWLPYALAFPHAAVAEQLGLLPGGWFFVGVLVAAPITHAIYGILVAKRSRIGLLTAAVLHIIFLAWSLKLADPFLA